MLPTNEHFTISDIVRIANTKIIQVDKVVYFLIKYPIPKSVCKKLIILPVAHNGKILHLQESIIAECRNHTLAVRNCSETVPSFCKASFSTSCALQLISSNNASCSTTFNNLSPVTEIDDGFIVINDQTVVIEEKYEPPLTVSGTYLVLFDDQVKINDTIFHNRNATVALSPGVPRAAKVNLKEHLEILSIPYLHHTNIKNQHHIRHLQQRVERNNIITLSTLLSLCGIVVLIYIVNHILKKPRLVAMTRSIQTAINQVANRSEDVPNLGGEELS